LDGTVAATDLNTAIFNSATEAVIDVANDDIIFNDHSDSHKFKREAFADAITAIAGTQATSALTATSGVLAVAPSDNAITIGADSLIYATAAGVTKKDLASDVVTAIAGTQASTALTAASGVLTVAPADNAITIGTDSLVYATAAGLTKKDLASDVVTAIAGAQADTALTAAAGVLTVAPADNAITIGTDSLMYVTAAGVPKKDLASDVATAMAGSGLTATAGVLSVNTIGIAAMTADDTGSIFFVKGEMDFGASNVIDVDLGALGTKGTLLGGWATVSEVQANGDATTAIALHKAAAGAAPICDPLTITLADTVGTNRLGAVLGIVPVAAGVDVLSTEHIYAYTADDVAGTRSAGKLYFVLLFQKSA